MFHSNPKVYIPEYAPQYPIIVLWQICTQQHNASKYMQRKYIIKSLKSRVTLYTVGHLHTAAPHCSHCRAPIVHTAVPREDNEHGCVYLHCRAVCKLPGCVEGYPWKWNSPFFNQWLLWKLSLWQYDCVATTAKFVTHKITTFPFQWCSYMKMYTFNFIYN